MKTEKVFGILVMISLLFKWMHWPGGSLILILSLSTLSFLYLVLAFYLFCDKTLSNQNIALSIVSGIFLSIIPIALVFKFQYWPGAKVMLLLACLTSPVLVVLSWFLGREAREELKGYYKNMVIRTAVLSSLAVLFFFLPSAVLINMQYGDDPELAKLKVLHYTHPDNEEYAAEHDAYVEKLDSTRLNNGNK